MCTADALTPPAEDVAIAAHDLRRTYRATRREAARTALVGVTITIRRGDWLGLLGPNGSGKSTLLRILATLDRADSGEIDYFNAPAALSKGRTALRARLGVAFQRPALDPLLTVRENLILQASLSGVVRFEAEDKARAVAAEMNLSDRMHSRVATLSGGLARRADIARALLGDPEILLLDEPTAGLDLDSRASLIDLLDQRRAAPGRPLTIIMTTHMMDEAERAGRVALMHQGRIVAEGAPAELRRALGNHVVVARAEAASLLESAGLTLTRSAPEAVGAGSPEAVERAAVALTRAASPFSVAPPTLADVYFAHTGARLGGEASP